MRQNEAVSENRRSTTADFPLRCKHLLAAEEAERLAPSYAQVTQGLQIFVFFSRGVGSGSTTHACLR